MLQAAGSGDPGACSRSHGGWMEMHGGLIFFFLWPPPTDCTLTGNAGPPAERRSPSPCRRQTSMEWRRWSSGWPADGGGGGSSRKARSPPLGTGPASRSVPSGPSALLAEEGGSGGGGGEEELRESGVA